MTQKPEIFLKLFCGKYDEGSVNTRNTISCFIQRLDHSYKIQTQIVDYDEEKSVFEKYHVVGVPTLFIYLNHELVDRHLGEISESEISTIIQDNLEAV